MFLHGIGGAKYDQLTDEIINKFFGFQPPEFRTLTATMKLPTQLPVTTDEDITKLKTKLREFEFHPETNLPSDAAVEAREIATRKREWIETELPRGKRLERHVGIVESNEHLQRFIEPDRAAVERELTSSRQNLRTSTIVGSREFSFCLFPESIVTDLKSLSSLSPRR